MTKTFFYPILAKDDGKTVELFLKEQGFSHHLLIHLKKTKESIKRDGVWLYMRDELHTGDCLAVTLTESEPVSDFPAVPLSFSIAYEDEDILIVNKPPHMPTHPSMQNYDNTLANAVLWYQKNKGESYPFRCINRLDKDTTGLTIIAKHALSAAILSSAIKKREIKREYLAIVSGETEASGTIDAPIARKENSILERQVDFTNGERAITHYKRLFYQDGLSLLLLSLETGRTHQIRVHMKYIGHPLIGDFLYHPDFSRIDRQALHAYRLSFLHPIKKEPILISAPLPSDMTSLFSEYFKAD